MHTIGNLKYGTHKEIKMKQKSLTKEQKELLCRFKEILIEAEEKNIAFVFDREDCSVSAYNNDGVKETYASRIKEDESDEYLDWDNGSIIMYVDYFDSFDQCYLLKF